MIRARLACAWLVVCTAQCTIAAESVDPPSTDAAIYNRTCGVCHMADGRGLPHVFPPLDQRLDQWATTELGRDYLVAVMANGLFGPINVGEARFSGAMPSQAGQLDDDGMSGMLNYVLSTFAPEPALAKPFTAKEIGQRRAAVTDKSALALRTNMLKALPGAENQRAE